MKSNFFCYLGANTAKVWYPDVGSGPQSNSEHLLSRPRSSSGKRYGATIPCNDLKKQYHILNWLGVDAGDCAPEQLRSTKKDRLTPEWKKAITIVKLRRNESISNLFKVSEGEKWLQLHKYQSWTKLALTAIFVHKKWALSKDHSKVLGIPEVWNNMTSVFSVYPFSPFSWACNLS